MPVQVNGPVELGDGWSLTLPNDCLAERNADGSWSAWDARRVVDVNILTATGDDGAPIDPFTMLGTAPNHRAPTWVGTVDEVVDTDHEGLTHRLTIAAAAPGTLLSCWISYRDPADRDWAFAVGTSIEHEPS
jgi:hypothetical protein